MRIGLSHDCDIPEYCAAVKAPLWKAHLGLHNIHVNLERIKKIVQWKQREKNWLFDEIMDLELAYGVRSTFFVCSANKFCEYGDKRDVMYDIKTERWKGQLRALHTNGFEIALHSTINAHACLSRIWNEKKQLEDIINCDVIGVRKHYYDQFNYQPHPIFKYDASIGSSKRNGAIWGYYNKTMNGVEHLPTVAMDINSTYSSVVEILRDIRDKNGFGVLNWHVRYSGQNTKEGRLYKDILHELAVMNCEVVPLRAMI
jgi:hypothetical protein